MKLKRLWIWLREEVLYPILVLTFWLGVLLLVEKVLGDVLFVYIVRISGSCLIVMVSLFIRKEWLERREREKEEIKRWKKEGGE